MKSTFWTRLPITILGIPAVIYVLNTGGIIFAGFVSLVIFLCFRVVWFRVFDLVLVYTCDSLILLMHLDHSFAMIDP